jgi:hypothetical protein
MIYTILNGMLLLPTFGIYQGYLSRRMIEAHNLKIKQRQDDYLQKSISFLYSKED